MVASRALDLADVGGTFGGLELGVSEQGSTAYIFTSILGTQNTVLFCV